MRNNPSTFSATTQFLSLDPPSNFRHPVPEFNHLIAARKSQATSPPLRTLNFRVIPSTIPLSLRIPSRNHRIHFRHSPPPTRIRPREFRLREFPVSRSPSPPTITYTSLYPGISVRQASRKFLRRSPEIYPTYHTNFPAIPASSATISRRRISSSSRKFSRHRISGSATTLVPFRSSPTTIHLPTKSPPKINLLPPSVYANPGS